MRFQLFILTIIFACSTSCGQRQTPHRRSIDTPVKITKHVKPVIAAKIESSISDIDQIQKLNYGFVLKTKVKIGSGKVTNYMCLQIWRNKLKIYTDTTQDYKLNNTFYPVLNRLKPDVFELLVQFDNNPSKDLVTFYRIENNKIKLMKQLPTFDDKPDIIDGSLFYHGTWDYGEMWNENGKRYTTYNPQAYYKFTVGGLKLDSALTILKSKQKYGRFDGLTYKGIIGYPSDQRGNIIDTISKNILRRSSD